MQNMQSGGARGLELRTSGVNSVFKEGLSLFFKRHRQRLFLQLSASFQVGKKLSFSEKKIKRCTSSAFLLWKRLATCLSLVSCQKQLEKWRRQPVDRSY